MDEASRVVGDQLLLLDPGIIATGEDLRRNDERVVGRPAHDGGVAVGGKRNGKALFGLSALANRDNELRTRRLGADDSSPSQTSRVGRGPDRGDPAQAEETLSSGDSRD